MPNIFISYRRDDAEAEARLLANAMRQAYGEDSVFFDRDGIRAGTRYPDVLRQRLAACDVLVAVIGRDWLEDRQQRRRLDDEDDWVRQEIAIALQRQILVVPALVKGALLPAAGSLPAPLAALVDCQAAPLRGESWEDDLGRLVAQLDPLGRASARLPGSAAAPYTPFDATEWRDDLQPLLAKVRAIYVDGWLAAAEREAALIGLETETRRSDAAELPSTLVQRTPLVDAYDRAAGSLLVLGEPGSGKTTALVGLARDLARRAAHNSGAPVPVVLRLSSWGQRQRPLADWLLEELQLRYHVPSRIGKQLLERRRLVLLLDGLDEMEAPAQSRCVEALNAGLEQLGSGGIVVSCRYREYTLLPNRLRLVSATFIRPLPAADIDAYLGAAGPDLQPLREAVKADAGVLALAQVPFFLRLLLVGFRHAPAAQIPTDPAAVKAALCNRYVQARLDQAGPQSRWAAPSAMAQLAWLARTLRRVGQTECHLENLQPSWLSRGERTAWFFLSRLTVYAHLCWVLIGTTLLVRAAAFWFGSSRARGWEGYAESLSLDLLPIALLNGLMWALVLAALGASGLLAPRSAWWSRLLAAAALFGGFVAAQSLVGLLELPLPDFAAEWPFVAVLMLLYSIRLLRPRVRDEVVAAERLAWSWRAALKRGSVSLVAAVGIGWQSLPVLWRTNDATGFEGLGQAIAIFVAWNLMLLASAAIVFAGITTTIDRGKLRPNEGIVLSLRTATVAGLAALAWYLAVAALAVALSADLTQLSDVAAFAAPTAVLVAFNLGGVDVLHHAALRWLLARRGHLPLRLAPFLDDAVEAGFLRRVGGGYTFLHRIFLDHLADAPQRAGAAADQARSKIAAMP